MHKYGLGSVVSIVWVLLLALTMRATWAQDDAARAREIVEKSHRTVENFLADPAMTWFRDNVGNAKALFIVPTLVKAGFVFGGSGGTGALLAADQETGKWSYPAFYTMGSVTWGLQIGAEASEVVLMVMTDKGMESMLRTSLKLGGDVSVAAGPVGAGAKAATSDIISFSRSKGVYGGLTLEGAVITVRDSLNDAFYGAPVRPIDILIRSNASNPKADPLIAIVTKATRGTALQEN